MTGAGWDGYEALATELARGYESLRTEDLHGGWSDLLPDPPAAVLDVGAGSGRDAAWFSARGYEVIAVEPSDAMRAEAQKRHPGTRVRWLADSLPALAEVYRLGLTFDVILLSAVWMHVPPTERQRAFRKLMMLLRPSGLLVVTLRLGPSDPQRRMYPVSAEELVTFAASHAAALSRHTHEPDRSGRTDVRWESVVLRLSDDGTGALPLLRHIILNDQKSATYKLGLLRAVARAADGASGMACPHGDERVSVPLGLIALNWLRLYKPLIDARLPQLPNNRESQGLGFAGEGWQRIASLSALDLRVGARFRGEGAGAVHAALREAARTITEMPAHYLTWPGTSEPVMMAQRIRAGRVPAEIIIDERYLRAFGELLVPTHLWRALARYDVWIEPALVAEWIRLMEIYALHQDRKLDPAVVARAMVWAEPARDVAVARRIALDLMAAMPLYCTWTGKRLTERSLDIDHCMPWSAWPCEDLWNLVPADRTVNQHKKRQKLPSAGALVAARDLMMGWWGRAYVRQGEALSERFFAETAASLSIGQAHMSLDLVFDGVEARRMVLRLDQQVEEWTPD